LAAERREGQVLYGQRVMVNCTVTGLRRNKANSRRCRGGRRLRGRRRGQMRQTKPIPGNRPDRVVGCTNKPNSRLRREGTTAGCCTNKPNLASSGFGVLRCLLGLCPKPRHFSLSTNSMIRAGAGRFFRVDTGPAGGHAGGLGIAATQRGKFVAAENRASGSSYHAIGPKRKMPGARGQRPRSGDL